MAPLLLALLTSHVATFQFDEAASARAAAGKSQLEALAADTTCSARAVDRLRGGCREMDDQSQSRLAVDFTNCHLAKSGLTTYECTSEMSLADCTKPMVDSAAALAFNAYTHFYTHAESMCFYLQSREFQRSTETLVDQLHASAQGTASQLDSLKKDTEAAAARPLLPHLPPPSASPPPPPASPSPRPRAHSHRHALPRAQRARTPLPVRAVARLQAALAARRRRPAPRPAGRPVWRVRRHQVGPLLHVRRAARARPHLHLAHRRRAAAHLCDAHRQLPAREDSRRRLPPPRRLGARLRRRRRGAREPSPNLPFSLPSTFPEPSRRPSSRGSGCCARPPARAACALSATPRSATPTSACTALQAARCKSTCPGRVQDVSHRPQDALKAGRAARVDAARLGGP